MARQTGSELAKEFKPMRIDAFAGYQVSSVLVVDPYEVVYAGISTWLREDSTLCGTTTAHYTETEQFLCSHPIPGDDAEVVLLGLNADEAPHFAAVSELTRRGHRVVVYSHLTGVDVIRAAVDAGALTYLTKAEGREHLLEAIRLAVTSAPYRGPSMAAALEGRDLCHRPVLAPREQQVLLAWIQNDSKDLVAQQLFLAPSTVRTHLQRIRAKYTAAGRPAGRYQGRTRSPRHPRSDHL
ncbi:response regulator transcription factor, partial [Mycolicibacterium sp. CBMA 361]|uniref:LuxR C-terminal-related transcriptional regulator n=1 Tax=Mycolicibacterium sp. CBMA 361 TaxID=2606610 RepID=UPI0012DCC900